MKRSNRGMLIFIIVLFLFSIWAILPSTDIFGRKEFKLGLDLRGGSHLVYKIDMSKKDPNQTEEAVADRIKGKIEARVNAYGVTEPIVQNVANEQGKFVLVQLPGVKDINEAMKLIGQTAELDFMEPVAVYPAP